MWKMRFRIVCRVGEIINVPNIFRMKLIFIASHPKEKYYLMLIGTLVKRIHC